MLVLHLGTVLITKFLPELLCKNFHCKIKTVAQKSHFHIGYSYTAKTIALLVNCRHIIPYLLITPILHCIWNRCFFLCRESFLCGYVILRYPIIFIMQECMKNKAHTVKENGLYVMLSGINWFTKDAIHCFEYDLGQYCCWVIFVFFV